MAMGGRSHLLCWTVSVQTGKARAGSEATGQDAVRHVLKQRGDLLSHSDRHFIFWPVQVQSGHRTPWPR